jgi:hypothetical protein
MGYLERIAERVETFYTELAALSLYHPESEANPARARWKFLQRRIKDGSFFVLARKIAPLNLDKPIQSTTSFESKRNKRQSVSFDHILSQAVSSVSRMNHPSKGRTTSKRAGGGVPRSRSPLAIPEESEIPPVPTRPIRLADAHTARARGPSNSTSYEEQNMRKAANRMSQFMAGKIKDMRRLSKNFNALSLEHAMSRYGSNTRDDEGSSDSGSVSSIETPRNFPEHQRSSSRQVALDRLAGSRGVTAPLYTRGSSRNPSSAESESGRTERSVRTVISKSDLHSATFSRKLSVYSSANAKSSHPTETHNKPSHW